MNAATKSRDPLLDRGWAALFAGDFVEALRVALAVVEHERWQPSGMLLLLRALESLGASDLTTAADKLVDVHVRRGDLPGAVAAAAVVERVGGDAAARRREVALAFGRGSSRVSADASPLPPPLPPPPSSVSAVDKLGREALCARASKALAQFVEANDPVPHGPVPELPLFSALDPAPLERLLAAFEVRDLPAGETAIRQGEEGREAFVVVHGSLRAERASARESGPTVLAVLGPGAIFGEMALVSDAPRAASVIAQAPTSLLAASREALEALAADEPVIGKELGAFCRTRMIANLLRTSPLLRAIPAAERAQVIARFDARTFREGEILVEEGTEPSGLFLLASGGVRVSAKDSAGDEVVVADLGPGDVVGEVSIVLRRPAIATVRATHPTVALELSRARFQEAIRAHPSVLGELYQLATQRQDELHSVVAQEAVDVTEVVLL